jgi:hypothetical protein
MSLPVVIAIALVLVVAALVAKKVLTPEAEEPRSPPSAGPSRALSQRAISPVTSNSNCSPGW